MPKDYKIETALKNKVIGSIELVIREIFSNYFGVNVCADDPNTSKSTETKGSCLCQVHMKQEDMNIFLCFNFDVELLYVLVEETYDGEGVKDPESYQDAACEIANIICCKVKSLLNDSGYHLNMDLPRTVVEHKKLINSYDDINMHFCVDDSNGFSVNLFTAD